MKARKYSFDILRCIAIFFVLVNHRDTYSYFLRYNAWDVRYVVSMVISILCKSACPVFFMISGALLLGKEESYLFILKHRIWRIVSAMILFSALYVICNQGNGAVFINLLLKDSNWYLFAYLAFLIMLPFFRSMVQGMDKEKFRMFLVLCVVFYAMPAFMQNSLQGNLFLFCSPWASSCWHIVFPVLGYYYANWDKINVDEEEKNIQKIVLVVGSILSMIIFCILMKNDIVCNEGQNMELLRQYAILLPACLIFVIINEYNKIWEKLNDKLKKIILTFSAASFGIFLLEVYTPLNHILDQWMILKMGSGYVVIIIIIMMELVIDTVVITIAKKVPVIKNVL